MKIYTETIGEKESCLATDDTRADNFVNCSENRLPGQIKKNVLL